MGLFVLGIGIALLLTSLRNAPSEGEKLWEAEHGARVLFVQEVAEFDYTWKPNAAAMGLLWQNELNHATSLREQVKNDPKTPGTDCYEKLSVRTADACADFLTARAFKKLSKAIASSDSETVMVKLTKRDRVALALLEIVSADLSRYQEASFAVELNPTALLKRWMALSELRIPRQITDSASFEELTRQLLDYFGK